jgi:hypothetical protein
MFITIVGAGAVGAPSRYGSGSDQMMRLRLRNTALNRTRIQYFFFLLFNYLCLYAEVFAVTNISYEQGHCCVRSTYLSSLIHPCSSV